MQIRLVKEGKGLVTLMVKPTRPGEGRGTTTVQHLDAKALKNALANEVARRRHEAKPESPEGS